MAILGYVTCLRSPWPVSDDTKRFGANPRVTTGKSYAVVADNGEWWMLLGDDLQRGNYRKEYFNDLRSSKVASEGGPSER
jgi:hypothetical protein